METAVWVGIIAAVAAVVGGLLTYAGTKRGQRGALIDIKLTQQFAKLDEKKAELTEAYREVVSKWTLKTNSERVGALEVLAVCDAASKELREATLALRDSQQNADDRNVAAQLEAVRVAYLQSQDRIDARREELVDFLRREGRAPTRRLPR